MALDLFISYSRADREKAEVLAGVFTGRGWTVWWDHELSSGDRFGDVIEKRIEEARLVIALWSETAVKSRWVLDEATMALELGKLVTVRIDGTKLPLGFRQLHAPELSDVSATGTKRLCQDIAARLGVPDPIPAPPKPKLVELFGTSTGAGTARRSQDDGGTWTVFESYLALVYCAAVADGILHEEQRNDLLRLARRSTVLGKLSLAEMARLQDVVSSRVDLRDDALEEAALAIPDELKLPVFAQCFEIVIADGVLRKSEALFMERLAELLKLDPQVARQTVEVLLVKAKG